MVYANLRFTASQQLLLRASEAQAHVVSKGGDPGNCHSIQLGKYQGQTFRWLLENDVGYTTNLIASHQHEWEQRAFDISLMANKDALVQYSCAHPAVAEQVKFRRVLEEARARATLPRCEGEALVGFGEYREATLKDLYDSKEKRHRTFVKWLRRKTLGPRWTPPGSTPSSTPTTTSSGPSKAAASTALPPRKPFAAGQGQEADDHTSTACSSSGVYICQRPAPLSSATAAPHHRGD
ncbi:uncharacterized protein LOC143141908 [Alosa pseudoharengus]|uniref:uncharacterized protein LOC143141908 n=1 Tax=Alosa pseudoharengus TaxID=34774 RepID=UPI003F8AA06C